MASGKYVWIGQDILDVLGLRYPSKSVGDALRAVLGLAAKAAVVKKKPKRRRIWLKDIPVGTTMTYPRREYKWNSVMANVYKHNKTDRKFSASWDVENIYVTRIKP